MRQNFWRHTGKQIFKITYKETMFEIMGEKVKSDKCIRIGWEHEFRGAHGL